MKAFCVYDDHVQPNAFIRNIIGERSFGEVILKRKSVKNRFQSFALGCGSIEKVFSFDHSWQMDQLLETLRKVEGNTPILHYFSNFAVQDEKEAELLLRKIAYMEDNYVLLADGIPVALVMRSADAYIRFLSKHESTLQNPELYVKGSSEEDFLSINANAFYYLGDYEKFLRYISGGFDVRFFNVLRGDALTVVKSSQNSDKIFAEYKFYHLLPDDMKMWFVMPYDFQKSVDGASYRMERYYVPDLALRWVHRAIGLDEMDKILEKLFLFINTRKRKEVTAVEQKTMAEALYLTKVRKRLEELKKHKQYAVLDKYITTGTRFSSGLDEIFQWYESLFEKTGKLRIGTPESVIGHGDLCFSNILFSKDTNLLRLIDPKGAVKEEELWTDPYYDIAKLSHSICGLYDFFNSDLHHITLDTDLIFRLEIDFDNTKYMELFKKYVEKNGFSYLAVRIYEASLFLSMLPLHMDRPQKVFGFILNAIQIMEDIEQCMKT